MNLGRLLSIEEVALLVGCSIHTIELWYRFKRNNPDNEYAKTLPDYIQELPRQKRFWREEDVEKLIKFQSNLPKGRNGIMGNTSRKYYHGGIKNGKKKISARKSKNRNNKTSRIK